MIEHFYILPKIVLLSTCIQICFSEEDIQSIQDLLNNTEVNNDNNDWMSFRTNDEVYQCQKTIYDHFSSHQTIHDRFKRKVKTDDGLWPNGIIPITVEKRLSNGKRLDHTAYYKFVRYVWNAIYKWRDNTCLQFVRYRKNQHENYVQFSWSHEGCWSYVGMLGGKQLISLNAKGCLHDKRVAVHELGHTIGLHHEHERADRDKYLSILWENVDLNLGPFTLESFYRVDPNTTRTYGNKYDYNSIMHYGSNFFAKQQDLYTMMPYNRVLLDDIEIGKDPDFWDYRTINKAYACDRRCDGKGNKCHSPGYILEGKCGTCICPKDYAGKYCETNCLKTPESSICSSRRRRSYDVNHRACRITINGKEISFNIEGSKRSQLFSLDRKWRTIDTKYVHFQYSKPRKFKGKIIRNSVEQKDCVIWLNPPKNYIAIMEILTFDNFNNQFLDQNCNLDSNYVRIHLDGMKDSGRRYCNQMIQSRRRFRSKFNEILLKISTVPSKISRPPRMKFRYKFIKENSITLDPEKCNTEIDMNEVDSATIISSKDLLRISRYLNETENNLQNYSPFLECSYNFKSSSPLKIIFINFELELSSNCKNDYLVMTDGGNSEKYCGFLNCDWCRNVPPKTFISQTGKVTFRFHSNRSIQRQGFEIRVTKKLNRRLRKRSRTHRSRNRLHYRHRRTVERNNEIGEISDDVDEEYLEKIDKIPSTILLHEKDLIEFANERFQIFNMSSFVAEENEIHERNRRSSSKLKSYELFVHNQYRQFIASYYDYDTSIDTIHKFVRSKLKRKKCSLFPFAKNEIKLMLYFFKTIEDVREFFYRHYHGNQSITRSGLSCAYWAYYEEERKSILEKNDMLTRMERERKFYPPPIDNIIHLAHLVGLDDTANYCRNPEHNRLMPWCFVNVTSSNLNTNDKYHLNEKSPFLWDYCSIDKEWNECKGIYKKYFKSKRSHMKQQQRQSRSLRKRYLRRISRKSNEKKEWDCISTIFGTSYVGKTSETLSGKKCIYWSKVKYFHVAQFTSGEESLNDMKNYCRFVIPNVLGKEEISANNALNRPICYYIPDEIRQGSRYSKEEVQEIVNDLESDEQIDSIYLKWAYCDIPLCYSDECSSSANGLEYRGSVTFAEVELRNGIMKKHRCEPWWKYERIRRTKLFSDFPKYYFWNRAPNEKINGNIQINAKNFCRLPYLDKYGKIPSAVKTYENITGSEMIILKKTLKKQFQYESCRNNIPQCNLDDCINDKRGFYYQGNLDITMYGMRCQSWKYQREFSAFDFPDANLKLARNFCRNPRETKIRPWCWVDVGKKVWQYCLIPKCKDEKDRFN
ncbi:hypothetical protein SNEBB_002632 [Seison nebaliae]|nr:hypothetical protein SNEBB_002632 [Seison nebaliae]